MYRQRFKLKTPTLSFLANTEIPKTPVMIPAKSTITIIAGDLNGSRLIDVEWNGKTLKMFAADLRARGTSIA